MNRHQAIRITRVLAVLAVLATPLVAAGSAGASSGTLAGGAPQTLNQTSGNVQVPGHQLTPLQALEVAASNPRIAAWLRDHRGAAGGAVPDQKGADPGWDVAWMSGDADAIAGRVDEHGNRVVVTRTGPQAVWGLARGGWMYDGAGVGHWYVWLPLCLLFLAPFVDPKRPFRRLHFDLLGLLALSVSLFFFSSGRISASVPLVYPVLAYLLVRMLLGVFRPQKQSEPLVPYAANRVLAAGIVVLVVVRILAEHFATVLDVGAAGVGGAHLLVHGHSVYGGALAHIVGGGDTYGPINYLAYVPFLIFHSTYRSAQAASIAFDLLTLVGLFLLGRRVKAGRPGTALGLAMAYAWASYPFSAFVLQENTNDSLVAALLVLTLLVAARPARRGVMLAIATFTKFIPVLLVPLMATGPGPRRMRSWAVFGAAFVIVSAVIVAPFAHSLDAARTLYHSTIGYQMDRPSPFSIWGLYGLHPLQHVAEAATILLALSFAFVPRLRTPAQLAAATAAVIIAVQLCASYWYYPYVVWFAPLVFAAVFPTYLSARERSEDTGLAEPPLDAAPVAAPPQALQPVA